METNSRAFEQTVARVKPGMREQDLAAELEYRMRRLGAEKASFETIVAAGERSALPHAQPTAARLGARDLVVVDMGAFQDGYASDMTRMLSWARPSAKVKRMYRAVLEAQLAAIDAVRPGATTVSVDAAARRVLAGLRAGSRLHPFHRTRPRPGDPRTAAAGQARQATAAAPAWRSRSSPAPTSRALAGCGSRIRWWSRRTGCEILTPTPKDLHIV